MNALVQGTVFFRVVGDPPSRHGQAIYMFDAELVSTSSGGTRLVVGSYDASTPAPRGCIAVCVSLTG